MTKLVNEKYRKKQCEDIIEELHEPDQSQDDAMESVKEDLNDMKTIFQTLRRCLKMAIYRRLTGCKPPFKNLRRISGGSTTSKSPIRAEGNFCVLERK